MDETEDAVVVFTARSPSRIVEEKGSQAWVLNPARAKLCKWLVCTQNRHNPNHEFSDATEPHGSAFLVGRISSIAHSDEAGSETRWTIRISEYALINKPGVWQHWRNPVRYTSLSELDINIDDVEFHPIGDDGVPPPAPNAAHAGQLPPATLTIPEAKKALAATFGVKPEAIEITIRG